MFGIRSFFVTDLGGNVNTSSIPTGSFSSFGSTLQGGHFLVMLTVPEVPQENFI
jgi:hypothetical protein